MSQSWACCELMELSKGTSSVGGPKQQRFPWDPKIVVKRATVTNFQESPGEGAKLSRADGLPSRI